MPIVTFYLVDELYSDGMIAGLLSDASQFYAQTLYPDVSPPPIERVRAFVSSVKPQHWMTGGKLVSGGGLQAPYFTCLALAGRPKDQMEALLSGMTDVIVRHLNCERGAVRGQIIVIDPDHWAIGGQLASAVRSGEIAARAPATKPQAGS